MRFPYNPFVLQRLAEDRIFFVNPNMPFEFFLDCFQVEKPFFIVALLEDGRIAITPNIMVIPKAILQNLEGPFDLLPTDCEYVTMRDGTYPVIITAHPVENVRHWLLKFERWVEPFARQTLAEFVRTACEPQPLLKKIPVQKPQREPMPA